MPDRHPQFSWDPTDPDMSTPESRMRHHIFSTLPPMGISHLCGIHIEMSVPQVVVVPTLKDLDSLTRALLERLTGDEKIPDDVASDEEVVLMRVRTVYRGVNPEH